MTFARRSLQASLSADDEPPWMRDLAGADRSRECLAVTGTRFGGFVETDVAPALVSAAAP